VEALAPVAAAEQDLAARDVGFARPFRKAIDFLGAQFPEERQVGKEALVLVRRRR